MKVVYNVLKEPWIPVIDKHGKIVELGILDVLNNAHELIEISDSIAHYEYGIYRMLFVFIMDAYRMTELYEIKELLKKGKFDEKVIEEYVSFCNANGERFNLFDEKYPFMQCGKDQWSDAKIKSSANLSPIYSTGNNHTHFDHCLEKNKKISFTEAAKAVCSINLFCTSGAQGYPSTPSGAPPMYTIVKGNNLFETLVFGMVPVTADRNKDIPIWRNTAVVESKKIVPKVTLLEGLTFMCRRIRILGDEKNISTVLFEQGMNYTSYDSWIDPYVTYFQSKNGRANLKPNIDKEPWRNIDRLFNIEDGEAPKVIYQYSTYAERPKIHTCTYSVATSNAAYLDMYKGEYIIPSEIIRTAKRFNALREAIAAAESGGKTLKEAIKQLEKEMNFNDKNGPTSSERERTVKRYFSKVKNIFFGWFCSTLRDVDRMEIDDCAAEWKKKIKQICWDEYDIFAERMGTDIKMLVKAQKIKRSFYEKERKQI